MVLVNQLGYPKVQKLVVHRNRIAVTFTMSDYTEDYDVEINLYRLHSWLKSEDKLHIRRFRLKRFYDPPNVDIDEYLEYDATVRKDLEQYLLTVIDYPLELKKKDSYYEFLEQQAKFLTNSMYGLEFKIADFLKKDRNTSDTEQIKAMGAQLRRLIVRVNTIKLLCKTS